jgi:tRNA (guanine37-N1)-methyltransferase
MKESKNVVHGYDIIGNVALVKFERGESMKNKKKFAEKLLKSHNNIKTVLEKASKFSGRLRTNKTKFILGENTKEVLYRENGCEFRFNIDTCYFSPRLGSERMEIASLCRKGEDVLVLFGGVAPFAIVISKNSKVNKVVSVELGRACSKYALENVKRNKLIGKVEIIQGDVKRILPKINRKFDRIVMARPNLKDDFLESAFKCIKKGGMIYYYGFYDEFEIIAGVLNDLIEMRAKESGKKIKILGIKKAGDIGVRKYRYRADVKVLS